MRATLVAGLAFTALACGEEKARQAEAAAQASMTADSLARVKADSANLTAMADSVRRAASGKAGSKADSGRLRDSAVGPKFGVDANGKVVPIKPPAKKPD